MKTLEEAWRWFEATGGLLRGMTRIAEKHWDELPWDGKFGRDDLFRSLDRNGVVNDADLAREPLRDLAILVLFSVFESRVRQHVYDEVEAEAHGLRHRALRRAADDMLQRIDEGSFFRVLEPFKDTHADLVEQVNQVRRYRNWVAHGRRDEPPSSLEPRAVFDRLQRFLDLLEPPETP